MSVINSIQTGDNYFWIKIPRTGTYSYSRLFKQYNIELAKKEYHTHETYSELLKTQKLPGFTVVRHPVTRFYSVLAHYMFGQDACRNGKCLYKNDYITCIHHHVSIPTDSEQAIYNFFHENCRENFKDTGFFNDDIFNTQVYFAYHPKVKIFHFEQLDVFNKWIETTLGYDTSNLGHINRGLPKYLSNIDINHPLFVKTAEYLYNIDFKVFNYPLQYLT